jgi:hypothetical protein
MSRTYTTRAFLSTGSNRQVAETLTITAPDPGTGQAQAMLGVLSETVPVASFADVTANGVGTYQMLGSIPAGAIILGTKLGPIVGFAGDVSATITIGDGSDVDRYNTGTPSVFTTAAVGVDCGVPSGLKLVTTANRPTLTITSSSDFTLVATNGAGVVTVSIYYVPPSA